jgi:hypothetical protein
MIRSNNTGIDVEAVLKMIEVINLFRTFFLMFSYRISLYNTFPAMYPVFRVPAQS